jgi:hypothetical protein
MSENFSFIMIIGLPLSSFSIYNYLKQELGSNFKIPISKISNIKIENKKVRIDFLNSKNELKKK